MESPTNAKIRIDLTGPNGTVMKLLGLAKRLCIKFNYGKYREERLFIRLMSGGYKDLLEEFEREFNHCVELHR